MRQAIRDGFPPAVVEELMLASGLTLKELAAALDLSSRSLQRRRAVESWHVTSLTASIAWLVW